MCFRPSIAPARVTQRPEVFSRATTDQGLYPWKTFSSTHCSLRSGDTWQKWIFACFHDFQEVFSPKKPGFERPDNIEVEGPSVVYKFQQKSAWFVQEWLAARVTFLVKMELCHAWLWPDRCNQTLLSTTSTLFHVENMITKVFWLLVEVQLLEVHVTLIHWRWPGNLVHCQDCVWFRLYFFSKVWVSKESCENVFGLTTILSWGKENSLDFMVECRGPPQGVEKVIFEFRFRPLAFTKWKFPQDECTPKFSPPLVAP